MSKKKLGLCLLLIFFGFFFILGKCLDLEAQRVVNQFYPKDEQGIIIGNESVEITNAGNKQAIILIHGFLDSPRVYTKVIEKLRTSASNTDIYAPLLPYHARNLETASQLNNEEVLDFLAHFINELSDKYDCLIINGLSYGGALLSELALTNRLPKNIHLFLEAPSVHIIPNTPINAVRNHLYAVWRQYCNYKLLGCDLNYQHLKEDIKEDVLNEDSLMYKVIPAVFKVFNLDLRLRDRLSLIKIPHGILISEHDNRVSYKDLAEDCQENIEYCSLYSFPTGGHILHYGSNIDKFVKILLKHNNSSIHPKK